MSPTSPATVSGPRPIPLPSAGLLAVALLTALITAPGCTRADAAPPGGQGGGGGGGSSGTHSVDLTLAGCQALTPAKGDTCYPTDSPDFLVARTAGTWSYRYPGVGFDVTPPPTSGWTARNGASVSSAGGMRMITLAPGLVATTGILFETRTAPSTPYYVEFGISIPINTNGEDGAVLYETGSGKLIAMTSASISGVHGLQNADWTNATTYTSQNEFAYGHGQGHIMIFRWTDDGADRQPSAINPAGGAPATFDTPFGTAEPRTTFLTADAVGWGGYVNDATVGATLALFHYATGTP